MFASQAALVIANAHWYRDEQRARADLETLIHTSPWEWRSSTRGRERRNRSTGRRGGLSMPCAIRVKLPSSSSKS